MPFFSPTSCFLLPHRSKYSPMHLALKHPQSKCFLLWVIK
jgi:hypothetical protein